MNIGCSQLGDLFNCKPYGCKRRLWYKKSNIKPDFPILNISHIDRGNALQPLAIADYVMNYEPVDTKTEKLYDPNSALDGIPDGILNDGILEVKCPTRESYWEMVKNGIGEAYILQMQGYLHLTKCQIGKWYLFCADLWKGTPVEVIRNDELIKNILKEVNSFIESFNETPDRLEIGDSRCKSCQWSETCWADKIEMIRAIKSKDESDLQDLSENIDLFEMASRYIEIKKSIKDFSDEKEVIENGIKSLVKKSAKCGGLIIKRIEYLQNRLDQKKILADHPEFKEKYEKSTICEKLEVK